jgi:hypothetical protein
MIVVFMVECLSCDQCFQPGEADQRICNSCREKRPALERIFREAGNYKPRKVVLPPREEPIPQRVEVGWGSMSEAEEAWFNQKPEDYPLV